MTDNEIRIRSLYVFLACARALEEVQRHLATMLPAGDYPVKAMVEKPLRRELGLLFRYWTTRKIWEQLDANEADAKSLNVALLRLFTDAFKLPRDGSGLRYAELSTLTEEVRELSHRLTAAFGKPPEPLLAALYGSLSPWRETVAKYAADGVELPLSHLELAVKELAGPSEAPA